MPTRSQRLICDAFWDAMAGTKFASGCHRDVYSLWFNRDFVIKVEKERGAYKNIQEWLVWERIKDSKTSLLFAPCHTISADGLVLIQRRTKPLGPKEGPTHVLNWIADVKRENFGWYEGRIVCHDYANTVDVTTNRLKKWRPHRDSS